MMKPRICVFHQSLRHSFGGAAAVCVWTIEALKRDFEVFLAIPDDSIDIESLNRLYGTDLSTADFNLVPLTRAKWFNRIVHRNLKTVQLGFAIAEFKRIGGSFDLVINTTNEVPFPFPSLQYIHCPIRSYEVLRDLYPAPERWLRAFNNALFRATSGTSGPSFATGTRFVANSAWTAEKFKNAYGLSAKVIYPPVRLVDACSDSNFSEIGAVSVGRLVPDKHLHEAIEIVEIVRRDVRNMHLHIVGDGNGGYARMIEKIASRTQYVFLHKRISREQLCKLLRSHKFGIHPARNEHFGIAPAEMLSAGALVLVHNSGGQVEIVDRSQELVFSNPEEGASKLLALISDQRVQETLKRRLGHMRNRFSATNFITKMKEAVCSAIDMKQKLKSPRTQN